VPLLGMVNDSVARSVPSRSSATSVPETPPVYTVQLPLLSLLAQAVMVMAAWPHVVVLPVWLTLTWCSAGVPPVHEA
jgi:hypothetical protein